MWVFEPPYTNQIVRPFSSLSIARPLRWQALGRQNKDAFYWKKPGLSKIAPQVSEFGFFPDKAPSNWLLITAT